MTESGSEIMKASAGVACRKWQLSVLEMAESISGENKPMAAEKHRNERHLGHRVAYQSKENIFARSARAHRATGWQRYDLHCAYTRSCYAGVYRACAAVWRGACALGTMTSCGERLKMPALAGDDYDALR
jgi:hypothetical protein